MNKLIGLERNDFRLRDSGAEVKGCNIYLARSIDPEKGTGTAVERLYVSDAKAAQMGVDLRDLVGKQVKVYYNRFGRVDTIVADG